MTRYTEALLGPCPLLQVCLSLSVFLKCTRHTSGILKIWGSTGICVSESPPLCLESNTSFVHFKHLCRLQSCLGQRCSGNPVLTLTHPSLSLLSVRFCLLCGARIMLHCCVLLFNRTESFIYSTCTTILSALQSPSDSKVKTGVIEIADWFRWLT